MPEPLLDIQNLRVVFNGGRDGIEAVSGVSFSIDRGEVVSLVGESGSGKTVTALAISRLLPTNAVRSLSGAILFEGENILAMKEAALRKLRGNRIAYVFQEPGSALNPVFTVGYQIAESLKLHGQKKNTDQKVGSLLESVGIQDPTRVAKSYPHQISGGQQQRVMLAIALACKPSLLIADEPTTALDVTVQAQILALLKDIQRDHGMAVLFITHNLAIASGFANRMAVMYAGQIVEMGRASELICHPRHPYTKALIQAVPRLRGTESLTGIPGQVPAGGGWPEGCRFHNRCTMAKDLCRTVSPDLLAAANQWSRCHYWSEVG